MGGGNQCLPPCTKYSQTLGVFDRALSFCILHGHTAACQIATEDGLGGMSSASPSPEAVSPELAGVGWFWVGAVVGAGLSHPATFVKKTAVQV